MPLREARELGQLLFIVAVLALLFGLRRLRNEWPAWAHQAPAYGIGDIAAFLALLVDLSVQNERWGVNMDAVFMEVGADAEFERADADLDIAETVVSVSGFFKTPAVKQLELHLGVRYLDLDNDLGLQGNGPVGVSDELSIGDDWSEAFVGARFTHQLSGPGAPISITKRKKASFTVPGPVPLSTRE